MTNVVVNGSASINKEISRSDEDKDTFRARLDVVNKEMLEVLNNNDRIRRSLEDEDKFLSIGGIGDKYLLNGTKVTSGYDIPLMTDRAEYYCPYSAAVEAKFNQHGTQLGSQLSLTNIYSDPISLNQRVTLRPSNPYQGTVPHRSPFSYPVLGAEENGLDLGIATDGVEGDGCGGGKSAISGTKFSFSIDALRCEVRQAVSAELGLQQRDVGSLLNQVVAREWNARFSDVDGMIKGRFSELKAANEALQRLVLELSDSVQHSAEGVRVRVDSVEADATRRANEYRRAVLEVVRDLNNRVSQLASTVMEAKLDSDGIQKKTDELAKMHREAVKNALELIDSKQREIERDVDNITREYFRRQNTEFDNLQRAVDLYTGKIMDRAELCQRQTEKIEIISNECVDLRSQMRVCRNDINQLELLTRSLTVQLQLQQQQQTSSRNKNLTPDGDGVNQVTRDSRFVAEGAATVADLITNTFNNNNLNKKLGNSFSSVSIEGFMRDLSRLQQDVYVLKQGVAYLATVKDQGIPKRSTDSGGNIDFAEYGGTADGIDFSIVNNKDDKVNFYNSTVKDIPSDVDTLRRQQEKQLRSSTVSTPSKLLKKYSLPQDAEEQDNKLVRSSLD